LLRSCSHTHEKLHTHTQSLRIKSHGKIIGLFCRISSLLQVSFAKETLRILSRGEIAIKNKGTTGWRRLIGCLKLQVIFRKRATNFRVLLHTHTQSLRINSRGEIPIKGKGTMHTYWVSRGALCPSLPVADLVASNGVEIRSPAPGFCSMWCSVMQRDAVCCGVMQCVAV